MKKAGSMLIVVVIAMLFTVTNAAADNGWTNINGTVTQNGSPRCAMVLANGQYMFTCSGDGSFNFDVPLDGNGQITVYSFCSGLAPFKQVIYPSAGQSMDIQLEKDADNKTLSVTYSSGAASTPGWVRLTGSVRYSYQPVVAMVLANGQYMFTDQATGSFDFEVPPAANSTVTLYSFCNGKAPYKATFPVTVPVVGPYDGTWSGFARSSISQTNGVQCGSATATLQVSGNDVTGSVLTSWGDSWDVTGSVSDDGRMTCTAKEGIYVVTTMEGNLSGTSGSGTWSDFYGCYGTWTANKMN